MQINDLTSRRVRLELGARGTYIGDLLELDDQQARVRVTGVTRPARHHGAPASIFRGCKPGDDVVAAADAIVPTKETGHATYQAALQAELNRVVGSHSGFQTSPHGWVNQSLAQSLCAAIALESVDAGGRRLTFVDTSAD